MDDLGERYFVDLAAAFVRGRRPDAPSLEGSELVAWGRDAGLRVHKFKRPIVQNLLADDVDIFAEALR